MRTLSPALLAVALAVAPGCVKNKVQVDVVDELPPWMTKGEEVRLEVAKKLIDTGNAVGALDVIRRMREDGYDSPELDLVQGRALRGSGLPSEAEEMLKSAQQGMPRDARPAAELCILYADDKRMDEAIEQCTKATDRDDSNAATWNNLGFLLLAVERPDDALEACRSAVALNSTEARYRNNLGMAQVASGATEAGYKTFQSTMRRADAAYLVGYTLERFEGPEGARVWYEKTLQYDATHAEAKLRLRDQTDEGALGAPTGEEP